MSEEFVGPVGNATAKYDARNPLTRALLDRFLARVDSAALAAAPRSVLDVGCGEGVVTERLARLLPGASFLGVDADDERLRRQWSQRRLDNLTFDVASAYDLPFESGSFDLACALEVLEHLERPELALSELARVSRRTLLLSVPREPLWRISHLVAGRDVRALGNTPGHLNHWSSDAFERLVGTFGRVVSVNRPFPWTIVVVDVAQASC